MSKVDSAEGRPYNRRSSMRESGGQNRMKTDVNAVTATYLGEQQAEIISAGRRFTVGQRTQAGPPESKFCPIEMVAAGYAA